MFLEALSTANAMWDIAFPAIRVVWNPGTPTGHVEDDDGLINDIADGLRGVMEELDRRQEQAAETKLFQEHRDHIHTGMLQDELFCARRDEMIDRAAFNARYMEAMNKLYDIASRRE